MATTPYPFVANTVLTASQLNSTFNIPVSTKTASYTLVAADAGTRVVMNSASATTITVNTSLFAAGDNLQILNIGAGVCTVTAGTATVSSSGTLALVANAGGTLYFTSTGVSIFQTTGVTAAAGSFTFISKATFSAVASVSMPAGTFTSTYKNYKVLLSVTSTSASQILSVRANTGGTPDTGANYLGGFTIINTSGTVTGLGSNTTSGRAIYTHSTVGAQLDLTVYDPITAGTGTSWSGTTRGADSGDSIAGGAGGTYLNNAASNDGLTFLVGGTITGYYSVYGIKDS